MTVYESGREAGLLEDIKAGLKTVECRLDRGKFSKYTVGDQVYLRQDIYRLGKIIESKPHEALVKIERIEKYSSFAHMLKTVGYKKVVPRAADLETALAECYKYYSATEETEYGVLAIYFRLLKLPPKTQDGTHDQ